MDPPETFARITDWRKQAAHVPLTGIVLTRDGFTARTGIGFGFDDPMQAVRCEPPWRCHLVKSGDVISRGAQIEVGQTARGSCLPRTEAVHHCGIPRVFGSIEAAVAKLLFSRVVDGLLQRRITA